MVIHTKKVAVSIYAFPVEGSLAWQACPGVELTTVSEQVMHI
jgi:hypothetical protein